MRIELVCVVDLEHVHLAEQALAQTLVAQFVQKIECAIAEAPESVNQQLAPRFAEVINKALEKDRRLRYQSAADLRADLERVKRDLDSARLGVATTAGRVTKGRRWRSSGIVASATLVLLSVLAVTAWTIFNRGGSAIESIAVLPFHNGSGDANAEYLSDGLTESVVNNLSQLPSLRVSARSAVFRYKGKDADPQRVGQDLQVRSVLSGRLLLRGNTLVIRTELMDVANGSQLWGQEYTRKLSDVLALQDELSREISRGLRLTLTREEEKKLTKRYTEDPEAYQLYLKARHYWHRRTAEGAKKSEEYLRQAIDQDPAYALAYAALADSYSLASFFHAAPPRATMPKAKAAAAKALEIDDELAEAHISLGYASFTYEWDWPAAVRHFDRALALNRSAVLNHSYYPFYLTVGNRPDEAIDIARRAFAQDPLSASASHTLAVQLALAGKHDETIEESRRTIDLDPNFIPAHAFALVYAGLGDSDRAFAWLEKAYEERVQRLSYLRFESQWDTLRPDPRFQALLKRIGLPQ